METNSKKDGSCSSGVKHTPTPWTAEVGEVVTVTAPDGGRLAILGHLCGPHGSGGRRNSDEVAANARHIVQCVNAHDELVEALQAISKRCPTDSTVYALASIGDAARIALAKAGVKP